MEGNVSINVFIHLKGTDMKILPFLFMLFSIGYSQGIIPIIHQANVKGGSIYMDGDKIQNSYLEELEIWSSGYSDSLVNCALEKCYIFSHYRLVFKECDIMDTIYVNIMPKIIDSRFSKQGIIIHKGKE